ncbi:helix-turn-helix domain-containing protein [Paenibacillus popilliae]|uniref:helix-turn-helix domain-containing protein n=1 Tax=Paenibacillus popilliae TaxID=78057 RepID=UPI001F27C619|nr:helix-turn-helix domain-containing protein [Paenibacillus popilliae]
MGVARSDEGELQKIEVMMQACHLQLETGIHSSITDFFITLIFLSCYIQIIISERRHWIVRPTKLFEHMFQNYPDVVNVPQLCEMLGGISTKSAYKLLQENKINHFRIGRAYKIPKANVISYLHSIMTYSPTSHCDALVH